MRIGIDVDNVLSDTSSLVFEYAKEYDKKYKEGKGVVNPESERPTGKFDWNDEDIKIFLNKYIDEIVENANPLEDAVEIINKLKEEGNEIYIITNRNKSRLKEPYEVTFDWLNKNNVYYDKLIVDSGLKGIVCKDNDVKILIDDSIEQCNDAINHGINALLFDTKENQNKDIKRVHSWKEIYELLRK